MASYGQPRRINLVTIFLVLLAAAAAYAGWKLIPPWWQATKVDSILEDLKNQAADLKGLNYHDSTNGEEKLIDDAVRRIHDLGVDDPELRVWLTPDDAELDAEYKVVIHHWLTKKETVLRFHRSVKVPKDARGL